MTETGRIEPEGCSLLYTPWRRDRSADIHDKSYRVGRRSRHLLVTAPVGTARSPESYKEYICHTHQVESRSRPPVFQSVSQLRSLRTGRYRVCTCYVPFTPDLSTRLVYLSRSRINIPLCNGS